MKRNEMNIDTNDRCAYDGDHLDESIHIDNSLLSPAIHFTDNVSSWVVGVRIISFFYNFSFS